MTQSNRSELLERTRKKYGRQDEFGTPPPGPLPDRVNTPAPGPVSAAPAIERADEKLSRLAGVLSSDKAGPSVRELVGAGLIVALKADLRASGRRRAGLKADLRASGSGGIKGRAVPGDKYENAAHAILGMDDARLVALIKRWWSRPTPVEVYVPKKKASLPPLDNVVDRSGLPQLDLVDGYGAAPSPQIEMFEMPVMGPVDPRGFSWLLWLWDQQAGTDKMQRGGVVPWEQHLFTGSLLHLGINDRDGLWHTLEIAGKPFLSFDMFLDWLLPKGWQLRDKRKLPEALRRWRRLSTFPLRCGGEVQIMAVSYSVEKEMVEIGIRVPAQAAKGDSLDWPALCRYRVESAILYRAYLAACAWIGRSARHGQGITAEIAAPILGADGEPARRKGGQIKRSKTLMIPNPAAKFNPSLSDRDLTRLIGFDPDNRKHRMWSLGAFKRLNSDGVTDLQREGHDRFRLFSPRTIDA